MNMNLTRMDHDIDPGDNCDAWGNPLPVQASAAVASDPNVRIDPGLTNYQPPAQPVTVEDGLSRAPVDPASPASVQPAVDSSVGKVQFKKRIAADIDVVCQLAAVKVLEGDRLEKLKRNECVLHPEIRAARLRNLAACTNSFEELAEIHRMLGEMETPDTKHITDAAIRLAWQDVKPSREACVKLLATAISVADRIAQEVQADEAELFSKYDMKREPTSLTRKIAAVKAELQSTLSAVRGDGPSNPFVMPITHAPTGSELNHAINLLEAA